jgi:glutamate N-acetyltransferase / amino-acid N-acetyltransferase
VTEQIYEVEQCVTAPRGFLAGSIACGIKANSKIPDLALLASDVPCTTVGTFTTSKIPAAPVLLCQQRLASGRAQGVVVNSGNANCATGSPGRHNALRMTLAAAAHLDMDPALMLCSSTGIIGHQLPIEKIEGAMPQMLLTRRSGDDFSEAILTTDTRPKRMALEFEIDNRIVRLGGVAKGAGMIYPDMATMLCYMTTDAALDHAWIQNELRASVADTFNMIAIDGDMSTNDTCLLFANGLAGNKPINAQHPQAVLFRAALQRLMTYLAREIARDGEGATHLMTVHVQGAHNKADAIKAARAITVSPIWKCALTGEEPVWGRIVAALGASGCELQADTFDIFLGDIPVVQQGLKSAYSQERAQAVMVLPEVIIMVDLHMGNGQATAWGCNLAYGYIDENTSYRV